MRSVLVKLFLLTMLMPWLSCNKIKQKTEDVADKVKEKTKEQLEKQATKLIEKVYPRFDHDKPDTENNKLRFKDFLQVEISDDIKNIYCFDDAIGIDADYMFAFNCNEATSKKIIQIHKLAIDTMNIDNGFGMQSDFDWWDKDQIRK